MKQLACAVAAATALLPMAHGGVVVQSSLSNLRVRLVDLDRRDGIKPAITLHAAPWWGYPSPTDLETLVTIGADENGPVNRVLEFGSNEPFATSSLADSALGVTVQGAITAPVAGGFNGAGFLANMTAAPDPLNLGVVSLSTGTIYYTVTPMTAVRFTSRVVARHQIEDPSTEDLSASINLEAQLFSEVLNHTLDLDYVSVNYNFGSSNGLVYHAPKGGGPATWTGAGRVTLEVANGTIYAAEGFTYGYASIVGDSHRVASTTAPVPEPASWKLVLAGGAALWWLRRRAGGAPGAVKDHRGGDERAICT